MSAFGGPRLRIEALYERGIILVAVHIIVEATRQNVPSNVNMNSKRLKAIKAYTFVASEVSVPSGLGRCLIKWRADAGLRSCPYIQ